MVITDIISKPFRRDKVLCVPAVRKLYLNKNKPFQHSMKNIQFSGMSVRQRNNIAVLADQIAVRFLSEMLIAALI